MKAIKRSDETKREKKKEWESGLPLGLTDRKGEVKRII